MMDVLNKMVLKYNTLTEVDKENFIKKYETLYKQNRQTRETFNKFGKTTIKINNILLKEIFNDQLMMNDTIKIIDGIYYKPKNIHQQVTPNIIICGNNVKLISTINGCDNDLNKNISSTKCNLILKNCMKPFYKRDEFLNQINFDITNIFKINKISNLTGLPVTNNFTDNFTSIISENLPIKDYIILKLNEQRTKRKYLKYKSKYLNQIKLIKN